MKYIKKFDSVAAMTAALANSPISVIGMAMNGNTPVVNIKEVTPTPPGPDYSIPFFVENITNSNETLLIRSYDNNGGDNYLEITVEYSTDGTSWSTLGTTGETALTRTLQPNDKVYLRANTNGWFEVDMEEGTYNHGCSISGVSKVGGNILSLLYGSNFTGNETTFPVNSFGNFYGLFTGNEDLVSASELLLPATTLTMGCYESMFDSCTSLTTAPALPATTLADYCYESMFDSCTSLTTAPALPATTLAECCYCNMFCNCESLTTAPVLPATTLASNCYDNMFMGCTSLTTAPTTLPATTLADYCYQNMFQSCSSLTTAPALPATTLAEECYGNMFNGCTSLTTAPALPATTLADYCYNSMFSGCTSLTTAPALPATTLADNCYSFMFDSCTSLTTAPELPATTLTNQCYTCMFESCNNLNYIKCLATDISANDCTTNWVDDIAATGTFVKDQNMSSWTTGVDGIPSGWTVQDATN